MNSTKTSESLSRFLKIFLLVDVAWAAILATLQSLILGQAGISIGANGVASSVAVGASWLATFALGLFQGAILLFFIAMLFGLWFYVYTTATRSLDRVAQQAIANIFLFAGGLNIFWALLNGAYAAAVVAGLGSAPAVSASMPVIIAASSLSFIVSFTTGIFSGAVILTLIAVFVFVIGMLISFFKKG